MDIFQKFDELVDFIKQQENVEDYDALIMIGAVLFSNFEDESDLEDFIDDVYAELEDNEDFYFED